MELRSQFPMGSIFCTLYFDIQPDGRIILPDVLPYIPIDYRGYLENYLDIIHWVLPFNTSSFVVTKQALQAIGGFPVGIKYGEDVYTFIRLSLDYKFVFINKPLAFYHRDAENRSTSFGDNPLQEYYPARKLVELIRCCFLERLQRIMS